MRVNNPKAVKMKDQYLLYARKSTESEDRQVASIDNQLEVLWKLAEEKGINILATFTESVSAKAPGRTAFNQMIDCINTRNDIKGILCWKLNRLSRNPEDSGKLRQLLYDGRIEEIVTFNKTYTEGDSDFLMAIEDAQSQKFIRDLREDTQRGIDKKLEMGNAPILAPAGYKNDMEKRQGERTISPHPIYFKLVRKLFKLAMSGKFSTTELYKKALQMGIKTSLGRPISRTQMFYLLKNPFYTGRFYYKDILYEGSHKPMLTDAEFDSVQSLLQSRSFTRKQKHEFPLNGFIRCSSCKSFFTGEQHVKKSGLVYEYYKCSMKGRGCKEPMISAKDLDSQVDKFLKKITISKAYVEWMIKWLRNAELQDRQYRNNRHAALKTDYTNAIKRLDNLTDKWLSKENEDKSLMTEEEYKRHRQRYLHEKSIIYSSMKNSDQEITQWTDVVVATFNFATKVRETWRFGTIDDKKNILIVIGSELTMKNKKLSIKPRAPFRYIEKVVSNSKSEPSQARPFSESTVLGGLAYDVRTALSSNPSDFLLFKQVLINKFNYETI